MMIQMSMSDDRGGDRVCILAAKPTENVPGSRAYTENVPGSRAYRKCTRIKTMIKKDKNDDGNADVSFLARPSENWTKVSLPLPSQSTLTSHRDTCSL